MSTTIPRRVKIVRWLIFAAVILSAVSFLVITGNYQFWFVALVLIATTLAAILAWKLVAPFWRLCVLSFGTEKRFFRQVPDRDQVLYEHSLFDPPDDEPRIVDVDTAEIAPVTRDTVTIRPHHAGFHEPPQS